jgi:hypothetical protein
MDRGEQKRDVRLPEDAPRRVGRKVQGNAERLEDVRAPGAARSGAIAVLGDGHARSRDEDRGAGREVHRAESVASGAARVEQSRKPVLDPDHRAPERLRRGGDRLGRLAFDAERGDERRGLHRGPAPREDRVEYATYGLRRDLSGAELGIDFWELGRVVHHRAPPSGHHSDESQLARSLLPCSDRIDSGWNCTPSTRSVRWRRAMSSPSGLRAVTSRQSGSVFSSIESEW